MKRGTQYSDEKKKEVIKALIENGLNFKKTADEHDITRQTLYKWKEEHYLEFKDEFTETKIEKEAKRLPLPTDKIRRNTEHLFDSAVEFFLKNNGAEFKKLKGTQQVRLMEVIAPYVLQKKQDEKQPKNTQNNFFANFFNTNNNGNKENNESTYQGHPKTIKLPR